MTTLALLVTIPPATLAEVHFTGRARRLPERLSPAANKDAPISGASNTMPIQITTSAANEYVTGQAVQIGGVGGNTNANGTWIITVKTSTTFLLNGSSGNASYTFGGTVFTTTVTTVAPHGLVSSQQVMLAGVDGTTNANGRWRITVVAPSITVVAPNQFSIASQWNAAWKSGGCIGDGGITIPSSVTRGRWRRIYSDAINVRWFGATGDGTTDDTTSIQGALCAVGTGYYTELRSGVVFGGGKLQIPAGTYRITAPLNVPEGHVSSNIVVEGAGQDNTILKGYGYFFPIIQSVWGNLGAIYTFLCIRDLTITSDYVGNLLPTWSPGTAYSAGTIITSGLSNRLLQCTTPGTSGTTPGTSGTAPPTSGAHRPFGQLWSGVISDPVVWITGNPSSDFQQVIIEIVKGGPVGKATFEWSTDGKKTVSPDKTTATSVELVDATTGLTTGLTAHFSPGTYVAGRYYCSPPMGYGFSTVHETTVADNTVEWTVIDGGCGILQVNGGEVCIERVHFLEVVVGIIFDGTELSIIRDCIFGCPNGIWITGSNQRLNNPAIDTDALIDQSNDISVEDCWFDCSQLSFAAESNALISLSGANFNAGQWYGWTTGVLLLKVFNMNSAGGYNGWFVGSLAPFNGNASFPTTNATFENCLIRPSGPTATGPAVQASNYAPVDPLDAGFQALGTPFGRLSFIRCYLGAASETISAPTNGFTDLTRPSAQPSSIMAASYLLPTSAGSFSTTWTLRFSYAWASAIVAFHAASTGAPVLVQQVANSGTGLSSLSLTLPQLPTTGNLLVICHDSTSGGNSTVSGGGVATWTLCQSSLPAQDNSEIWAGVVGSTPSTAITITLGGSPNDASAIATEWRGLASPPVFSGIFMHGTDGTLTSPVTTGSMSANANDLVIATVGARYGSGYIFVGMGTGSGFRVVDTIWGSGAPFDALSLSAISEYSDSAQMSAVLVLVQLVTNASGQMVNKPIGNGVNTTVVNPFAPRAQIITGPTAPFSLSGLVGGWDGQVIEIVNLSGQQMTINHLDPTETIAANQFMCSNGPPGVTLASAPGGFSWVRVSYSGSKSKWLVLDHS